MARAPRKPKAGTTTTKSKQKNIKSIESIESYEHTNEERLNNPPVGLVSAEEELDKSRLNFNYKSQAIFWIELAVGLKTAADVLREKAAQSGDAKIELSFTDSLGRITSAMKLGDLLARTYTFLMGLAIENLMKGAAVLGSPELKQLSAREREKKMKKLFNHNLRKLSEHIKVSWEGADSDTTNFLEYLTNVIRWAGRYPVAQHSAEQKSFSFDLDQDAGRCTFVLQRVWASMEGNGVFDMIPESPFVTKRG